MTEHDELPDLWIGNCSCGMSYELPDSALRAEYPDQAEAFDEGEFTAQCPECQEPVLLSRTTVKVIPFSAWDVMPAATGCPECGTDHEDNAPHNQQSLVYQYRFRSQHDRWPTWWDAMAHCPPEVQDGWIDALKEHGIEVTRPA